MNDVMVEVAGVLIRREDVSAVSPRRYSDDGSYVHLRSGEALPVRATPQEIGRQLGWTP